MLEHQLFNYKDKYQQGDNVYGYNNCKLNVDIELINYEAGQVIDYVEIDFKNSELLIYKDDKLKYVCELKLEIGGIEEYDQ